ncbi:MAG: aminotransferase class I/II-fold pyridoxal phosphate-dependent enzyme, partial [Limnochordia bacterium]
ISLLAPSKTFNIAGIGSSVTVIPNTEWKARYDQALKRSYLDLANIFAITAFAAAYRHGEEWLDQLLSLLSSNCSLAVDALSESGVRVRSPEGTYLLWLDFRSFGVEHGRLAKALVEHGKIGLSDGRSFGSEGTGFMRMNVGCPRSLVEEGIARIRSTIAYLSGYSE